MSSLPLSTSEASQEVAIRMGNEGIASLPPKTVMQNFDAQVTKNGNRTALYHKRPKQVSIHCFEEQLIYMCSIA
jgi:hypothetical protein